MYFMPQEHTQNTLARSLSISFSHSLHASQVQQFKTTDYAI